MKKYFYYVVSEEIGGKRCAYVDKVSAGLNICGRWGASQFEFVLQCESKKHAESVAEHWNNDFKKNNCYMF